MKECPDGGAAWEDPPSGVGTARSGGACGTARAGAACAGGGGEPRCRRGGAGRFDSDGYTSGVSFIDATGEPWPVARLIVEESFGPVTRGDGGGAEGSGVHTVYVTPTKRFLHGNAVVELADLASPVVLELKAGKGIVDSRLTVRVWRPGPNADPMVIERSDDFGPGDPLISSLLHGHLPDGARAVAVRGGGPGDRAWRIDGVLFLRTAKTLLAPQPQAFERGANGDTVYRLDDVPYAAVSLDGARVRLEFGGEVRSGG